MIKSSSVSCKETDFTKIILDKAPCTKPLNSNLLLEVDSDSSSQKSSECQKGCDNSAEARLGVSSIKKIDDEGSSLEKEDKVRVNTVRTQFYALNERFEQLLKFKPIRKLHLWQTEMNMPASYNIFSSFKIEEKIYSMDEQIKQLEIQLDLKDYYDIKRPTVVFFSMANRQLKVTRFDLLSEL